MDPLVTGVPDDEGFVDLPRRGGARVHFELYGTAAAAAGNANNRVLVVQGAFATKVHFSGTARELADLGFEVLLYDHRGVGPSGPPRLEPQTAASLAEDAVAVADAVWGPEAPFHVYGASMGGMVAQELAVLLLRADRLLSLGLAITCRGLKPLGGLLSPAFRPAVIRRVLQLWYWDSRPALVRRLMRLVLSRNVLEQRHPRTGERLDDVYAREWLARFDELWAFGDQTAGACHAHVVLHHWLSDAKLALIRDSGVPVLCQVALRDHLIPTALQLSLAELLRAKVVAFDSGHMGLLPWRLQYHAALAEHMHAAAALRGVAASRASRDWRRSQAVLREAAREAKEEAQGKVLQQQQAKNLAVQVAPVWGAAAVKQRLRLQLDSPPASPLVGTAASAALAAAAAAAAAAPPLMPLGLPAKVKSLLSPAASLDVCGGWRARLFSGGGGGGGYASARSSGSGSLRIGTAAAAPSPSEAGSSASSALSSLSLGGLSTDFSMDGSSEECGGGSSSSGSSSIAGSLLDAAATHRTAGGGGGAVDKHALRRALAAAAVAAITSSGSGDSSDSSDTRLHHHA